MTVSINVEIGRDFVSRDRAQILVAPQIWTSVCGPRGYKEWWLMLDENYIYIYISAGSPHVSSHAIQLASGRSPISAVVRADNY